MASEQFSWRYGDRELFECSQRVARSSGDADIISHYLIEKYYGDPPDFDISVYMGLKGIDCPLRYSGLQSRELQGHITGKGYNAYQD